MFLGNSALRRHCAGRIRGTCTPKNAIAKSRYLCGAFRHPRAFRTRSRPEMALPRPPVNRITSNRCSEPRTDVLLIRDQHFSSSYFPKSLKFHGKGDFRCQTRISDLERHLRTPRRPRRHLGVLSLDSPVISRHFHVFRGHVTFFRKLIIQKTKKMFPCQKHK